MVVIIVNFKKEVVEKGRSTPSLTNLTKETKSCVQRFKQEWYSKDTWLCGREKLTALFCWPCLLFSNESNVWTTKGVSDINGYYVLEKRHELSVTYINTKTDLHEFGNTRIEECLSLAFKKKIVTGIMKKLRITDT